MIVLFRNTKWTHTEPQREPPSVCSRNCSGVVVICIVLLIAVLKPLFYFVSFHHSLSPISLFSPAELNVELSRPLKINPTLAKLEQAKAYLKKVLPNHTWDTSSKPQSTSTTPHSSPSMAFPRAGISRSEPHHQPLALGKASSINALALSFHKVSLQMAQIVVVMETEAHPVRPSVTLTVSAMTGSLNVKSGPRIEGKSKTNIFYFCAETKT